MMVMMMAVMMMMVMICIRFRSRSHEHFDPKCLHRAPRNCAYAHTHTHLIVRVAPQQRTHVDSSMMFSTFVVRSTTRFSCSATR